MTEFADLVAAITARPADDTPRLIAADWLDDRGEHDYASFIRHQIQLHHGDPWDGFAIRARHQRKDELTLGLPYRKYLPELPHFLHWHPEKAFRRGFGSGVIVRQLSGLIEAGQQLFDLAPIDELWLGPATLDEWRHIARSPWLMNVRKVHLMMTTGLIEPIRCLAESPYSLNIDEIWFDTLATPAAGTVIEALAESKLALQLEGLHLRLVSAEASDEIAEALLSGRWQRLRSLTLRQCEFVSERLHELLGFATFGQLQYLDLALTARLSENYHIDDHWFFDISRLRFLQSLIIDDCNLRYSWKQGSNVWQNWQSSVQAISINGCQLYEHQSSVWTRAMNRVQVREFRAARTMGTIALGERFVGNPLWNRIRLLDISGQNVKFERRFPIRDLPQPPELETLILSTSSMPPSDRAAMDARFGDRIVWLDDPPDHGLSR